MDVKNNLSPKTAAELLFIISQFPYSQRQKIPNKFVDYLEQNQDKSHFETFKQNIPFTKQNFSEETIIILQDIYEKYLNQ